MNTLTIVLALFNLCVIINGAVTPFDGKYSDPNHPACPRVMISKDGKMASIYGADAAGGEGVACDGTTDTKWGPLPALIDDLVVVADFSSKGGPANLTGKYDLSSQKIVWEDGNYWQKETIKSDFVGAYSDPNHPQCDRLVAVRNGNEGKVYGVDAAGGEGVPCDGTSDIRWGPLPAIVDGTKITVDFSSKGGPTNLSGTYDSNENKIRWEDGNFWKKYTIKK